MKTLIIEYTEILQGNEPASKRAMEFKEANKDDIKFIERARTLDKLWLLKNRFICKTCMVLKND